MDCSHVRETLSAYIDGVVAEEERGQVEAHLQSCAGCSAELGMLRATVEICSRLKPVEPPAGFRAGLYRRLLKERESTRAARLSAWWRSVPYRGVVAGAAALLVFFALSGLFAEGERVGLSGLGRVFGLGPSAPKGAVVEKALPPSAEERTGATVWSEPTPEGKVPGVDGEPARFPFSVGPAGGAESELEQYRALRGGRMVVRHAELSVEVEDIQAGYSRLMTLADVYGGFVMESFFSTEKDGRKTGYVVLRVPEESLVRVLHEVRSFGKVLTERTQGVDVTERYVDLDARLANWRRQEERLLAILAKAQTIDEILRVEGELGRVRGEIEAITGQLKNIERTVAFSTLQVRLEEPGKPVPSAGGGLWRKIVDAFLDTVKKIVLAVERFIVFASSVLPLGLLGLAAWFLWTRIARERARRAAAG